MLLLTILSVLAMWALLIVLATGLLLVFKALQSVRTQLEKIAMGVRAIERQTAPLAERTAVLSASLGRAAGGSQSAAQRLLDTDGSLEDAVPFLMDVGNRR